MNVRFIVPILYRNLLPPPKITRERFRGLNETTRCHSYYNRPVHQVRVTEDVPTGGVVVEGYRRSIECVVNTEHTGVPLPEDRPGVPKYLQAFTTNPSGVFMRSAPVIQITENIERHQT